MGLFDFFKSNEKYPVLVDPTDFSSESDLLKIFIELYEKEMQREDRQFQFGATFNLQLSQYLFQKLPETAKFDYALVEVLMLYHTFFIYHAQKKYSRAQNYLEYVYLPFKEVLSLILNIDQDIIHEAMTKRMNTYGNECFVVSSCAKLEYLTYVSAKEGFRIVDEDELTTGLFKIMAGKQDDLLFLPLIQEQTYLPVLNYFKYSLIKEIK